MGNVSFMVDGPPALHRMCITIRYSKTDQLGHGRQVHIGRTGGFVCLMSDMEWYLHLRKREAMSRATVLDGSDPLFGEWCASDESCVRGMVTLRIGSLRR